MRKEVSLTCWRRRKCFLDVPTTPLSIPSLNVVFTDGNEVFPQPTRARRGRREKIRSGISSASILASLYHWLVPSAVKWGVKHTHKHKHKHNGRHVDYSVKYLLVHSLHIDSVGLILLALLKYVVFTIEIQMGVCLTSETLESRETISFIVFLPSLHTTSCLRWL